MQSRSIYNTHHNFAIVSTTLHPFDKRGGSLLQRSWSVHRHQIVIIIICCFFYITLHCQGTSSAVLHQCHTPCYFHQEQKLGVEDSMGPYYGRHGAKWCIHGKPIEFGYKMWVLATRLPYAVQSFCTKVKSFRHWMALILVVWLFIFIISFQIGLARSLSDTIIHILVLVFSRGGTQVFQQRWGQCHRVHTSQACMCLQ